MWHFISDVCADMAAAPIYAHMYTRICIYMYAYICVCIYSYYCRRVRWHGSSTYIRAYVYAYMYIYVRVYMCIRIISDVCADMAAAPICAKMYIFVRVYICAYYFRRVRWHGCHRHIYVYIYTEQIHLSSCMLTYARIISDAWLTWLP